MSPSKSCDSARAGTIPEHVATHLLLSVGFTCPFLLPSFFVRRNAKRVKYGLLDSLGLQQKDHERHRARGVEIWRSAQNGREATLAVALSNTQAELGSTIRGSIINTRRLPHSIQFRAESNIPQRYFSSTASSSVRSLPRVSGSRTTPGKSTVIRPSGCRQQSKHSSSPRDDNRSKVGHWMPSPVKPSLWSNIGTSSKPPTPADTSVTIPGRPSTNRPSITCSSPQKLEPKPKWVKAGISRTKVKPTGRKARRTRKKANKPNPMESDQKSNFIFEGLNKRLSFIPPFDTDAYETAVLEGGNSWKKLLANTIPPPKATNAKAVSRVKGIDQAVNKGVNSKMQKRLEKQTVVKIEQPREAEPEVPPRIGSRISVRGNGKIELTVGKGRKVLGTSPIPTTLPVENKRSFGTWVGQAMEDKHKGSSEEGRDVETKGVGAKLGESGKPVEVKNTLLQDSGIPKSQCLQAENSPIRLTANQSSPP